jgi:hypothetical protein
MLKKLPNPKSLRVPVSEHIPEYGVFPDVMVGDLTYEQFYNRFKREPTRDDYGTTFLKGSGKKKRKAVATKDEYDAVGGARGAGRLKDFVNKHHGKIALGVGALSALAGLNYATQPKGADAYSNYLKQYNKSNNVPLSAIKSHIAPASDMKDLIVKFGLHPYESWTPSPLINSVFGEDNDRSGYLNGAFVSGGKRKRGRPKKKTVESSSESSSSSESEEEEQEGGAQGGASGAGVKDVLKKHHGKIALGVGALGALAGLNKLSGVNPFEDMSQSEHARRTKEIENMYKHIRGGGKLKDFVNKHHGKIALGVGALGALAGLNHITNKDLKNKSINDYLSVMDAPIVLNHHKVNPYSGNPILKSQPLPNWIHEENRRLSGRGVKDFLNKHKGKIAVGATLAGLAGLKGLSQHTEKQHGLFEGMGKPKRGRPKKNKDEEHKILKQESKILNILDKHIKHDEARDVGEEKLKKRIVFKLEGGKEKGSKADFMAWVRSHKKLN